MKSAKPSKTQNSSAKEPKIFQLHPHRMYLYGALASMTVLFLTLTIAYLFSQPNWNWTRVRFPKTFLISTIIIVLSSFSIHKAVQMYKKDNTKQLMNYLGISLGLSVLFVVFQIIGWFELYAKGVYVGGTPDGSYLYVISALHALHVLGGVGVLGYMYVKLRERLKDPVKELLYYTNSDGLMQLEMVATYWHFVDILWIYLLFFFLFNHL